MNENAKTGNRGRMPKYIKYGLFGVAVLVVVAAAFWIYYSVNTGYVAQVGSEKIGVPEFRFYLNSVKNNVIQEISGKDQSSINPNTFWDTKIDGENARDVAKKRALDIAKEYKVQLIKAKEAKLTLEKSDLNGIESNISSLVTSQGSKVKAEEYLKSTYEINIDQLREILKEATLAGKLKTQETSAIKVTDEDVKIYYDKNPDKFKKSTYRQDAGEAVWVRHILISTVDQQTQKELPADKLEEAKKKAESLLARAKSGEDFAKLAKENSEDSGSAQYGGDYVFSRGNMMPEFEEASFALKPGEISGLVKTQYGYHIIKLEEKIAKDQPVSFKCATEYREFSLDQQYVAGAKYQEKVDQWKNEYKITINQSVYDSINIK
ncbi:MAG: peptidylprolyl isomerase [Clostridiales bacterium]|jgi:foldase protein PrsA|nr:peptidylprolyl isomerase [Eubacteriales bacterium]MDH7567036.1 peptidylprolyl isomerase [Clostridiales bacterium]